MAITAFSAWWFLPFVLPLCFYVAFTDLREMRITNQAVIALIVVFLLVGLIALPFDQYLWRLAQLGIVLLVTIALRRVAPHWASWDQENKKFPMGFPLGATLALYLGFGAVFGS